MSLNSGNCWDILEREATEDKKLIKRAYHKLLRQYKPDEHPKEFKILYQAYQDALEWEEPYDWEEEYNDDDDEDFDDETWKVWAEEDEQFRLEENPELQVIDESEQQWTRFQEKVDELTENNNYPERFNQLERWKFLEEISSDVLLDGYASQYLFRAVTEFEERFDDILLNQEVLLYMDSIFLWSKYWQNHDEHSVIFEYLTTQNAVNLYQKLEERYYPLASMQQRFGAFALDFFFVAMGIFAINQTKVEEPTFFFFFYFAFVAFVFWVLGLKTPAYYFLNLKVLEGDFCDPPTKSARGVRVILTIASFTALYWSVTDFTHASWFMLLMTGYNLSLMLRKEKLIQDISGTRVYYIKEDN